MQYSIKYLRKNNTDLQIGITVFKDKLFIDFQMINRIITIFLRVDTVIFIVFK